MSDMEKALMKREIITVKGRATVAKAKATAPVASAATSSRSSPAASAASALTRNQLDKATADLARSIKVRGLGGPRLGGRGRGKGAGGEAYKWLSAR